MQAFADRGKFIGTQLKACEDRGSTAFVCKPMMSNAEPAGRLNDMA